MRRTSFLVAALLVGLFVSDAAEAKPDYLKRYEAGLQAIEREDWDRATELMQKALMERANEAKRLSQWFYWQPYVPHFYYGLAQYNLDQCEQAMRSFNSSEEQGVLLGQEDLYAQMVGMRDDCESRGSQAATAGPGDSQEKRVRIGDYAESGGRILDTAAPLARSEKDQERLQRLRTGTEVVKVTDEEAERISEMADGSAPPALDRAVDAFFSGDPGQALAVLETLEDDDPKVKAHIYLLRSAAAHRLYLLSAKTDQGLLNKAKDYAAKFRAAGHPVAPPRSLFGPRFLEFLASNG